jgi:hypothetical protein
MKEIQALKDLLQVYLERENCYEYEVIIECIREAIEWQYIKIQNDLKREE